MRGAILAVALYQVYESEVQSMSIDGLFASALCRELSSCIVGGRIDRVFMPDRLQVTISVRQPGSSHTLIASAHPQWARLHLTRADLENPRTPPVFCMVLRKHLIGGRIRSVRQPGSERILIIEIEVRDEFGRRSIKDLVVEIMGKHSNIVLLGSDTSVIIDCAKHITSRVNRYREVLPGKQYILPPPQQKADLLRVADLSADDILAALTPAQSDRSAQNHVIDSIQGIGPLTAAEVLHRSGIDPQQKTSEIGLGDWQRASQVIRDVVDNLRSGVIEPCAYTEGTEGELRLRAFSAIELSHLADQGCREQRFPTLGDLLDSAVAGNEGSARMGALRSELRGVVAAHIQRAEAKLQRLRESLETSENADEFKLRADLLMACPTHTLKGRQRIQVVNYYDPNLPTVEIELDPALAVVDNAKRYYKRYVKAKRSKALVASLAQSAEEDLNYLRQVESGVESSCSLAELEEIRTELAEQGLVRSTVVNRRRNESPKSSPAEFVSRDGIKILVGKNNRQNDELTLRQAASDDIWLHAKDIAGSHVIVRAAGLKSVPETTLMAAALLAAYYSKARGSSNVPVDYTRRRHVRKPQGAKPGMVIYDSQSTLYVTPERSALEQYLDSMP
jgi:predicted ribosome quality control (RQC) complex YloA/Tae2 family protein